MTRDEFRQQMELYRQAREQNPQLSYWQWKTQLGEIVDKVNQSDANFVDRLNQFNRQTVSDWSGEGDVATHRMSWAEDENGNAIVYPEVQEINGKLHDFTDPRYNHDKWDALDSAIERGDTIHMTPFEAQQFTGGYKNYYPKFDEGTNNEGIRQLPYERVVGPYLDEVIVTPNGNYVNKPFDQDAYNSAMLDAWGKQTRMDTDVLRYLPYVGDAMDAYDVGKSFYNGNYLAGGIGLGMMLLPNFIEKPLKYLGKNIRNLVVSGLFNKINQSDIDKTIKLFRNSEWSNFISTKNGDNYYRLSTKPGLVSTNVRTDNGGYFISHTTPWEEFTGLGTSDPIGSNILYEFPTETFGKLKNSNSRGITGDLDVTQLGKQHLLYGNTASSERVPVRVIDDNTASLLDMNPYIMGIKDRPLNTKGFYDTNPIYEQLHQGNQTVISPELLNNALLNTQYNIYTKTPNGVQKQIYVPYSEGTNKDGIQSTSERPVTVNPYTGEFEYGYNPGAGYLRSVIDTRDLLDFTPVGNATTAYDAYNAYDAGNYLGAGLIGAAAVLPGAIAKPAKKLINRVIPTVNPNYVSNKINEVLGKPNKVLANGLDAELYTDVINQRNHIIEDMIEDSDYWDRAAQIYRQYGDDYVDAYSNIMEGYWNNYLGFPEPKLGAQDAMAKMSAKQSAIDRYNRTGEPAGMFDFEYQINPEYGVTYPITRHELSHYVDFNVAKSANADRNNTMFSELKKDLSKDKNPMYPDNTDYFRKGTEQKSYMNTLRQYMLDTGQIKSIGDKVTTDQIKKAINNLPSQYNSVKAAYKQFLSPAKYTKWFNKMPLLGIPGAAIYLNNKETNKSN